MKCNRLLLLPIIGLLFSSCAVLDTSMLDTAIPLKAKQPEVQLYCASGITNKSLLYVAYYDQDASSEANKKEANGKLLAGAKLSVGLGRDFELGLKTWNLTTGATVYKASLKKRIFHQDKVSLALIPAYTSMQYSDENYDEYSVDSYTSHDEKYKFSGLEIPLLLTYMTNKRFGTTLQAHYNYDSFSHTNNEQKYVKHQIRHYGLNAGIQIHGGVTVTNLELGIDVIPIRQGSNTVVPTVAIGLGFKLPD